MHLTPEQIDRQPFRMIRRGYDIVEVRDFLREIATEMRERQHLRERLAETGDQESVVEARAHSIISDAESEAAEIVSRAQDRAGSADALANADERADEILANAQARADALIEEAEARARERSGVVLSEAQTRLDTLLAEEREVRARLVEVEPPTRVGAPAQIAVAAGGVTPAVVGEPDPLIDVRDRAAAHATTDSSLADFMKSTLRHEIRPE